MMFGSSWNHILQQVLYYLLDEGIFVPRSIRLREEIPADINFREEEV